MPLSFHWRLIQDGEAPDLESRAASCREAERAGIESVLVEMDPSKPDPMALALALARETDRLRFLVEARPGSMSPTLFVQQVNTFSSLADGRIDIFVSAGDDRFERIDEFLAICRAFWDRRGPVDHSGQFYRIEAGRLNTPFTAPDRHRPQIYVGGDSPQARDLADRHGDAWLRSAASPETLRDEAVPIRRAGLAIALRLRVTCRSTREVADSLLAFQDAGVSRFLLSGEDDLEEMIRFGSEILPLIHSAGK